MSSSIKLAIFSIKIAFKMKLNFNFGPVVLEVLADLNKFLWECDQKRHRASHLGHNFSFNYLEISLGKSALKTTLKTGD
jgi:hypothetical protein